MAALTKKDYKYFEMARKVAEMSDFPHIKIGCVIVYRGRVLAAKPNVKKEAPIQASYNKKYRHFRSNPNGKPAVHSLHAEINALKSIPYPIAQTINWREVKVYTYRIAPGYDLGMGLSRPCPACSNALKDKGIQHFYYSTSDGFAYERMF